MKTRTKFNWLLIAVLILVLLPGCTAQSTTSASCAFVVGNGLNGNDAQLSQIIYPGQIVNVDTTEYNVSYFPCNSRNFIINDGTTKNANGETVGDRSQLITATTSTGVPIKIAARALWTLNQSRASMDNFYNICFKYNCASDKDITGDANFSTPGWNGMLAENFGPAMDTAARIAAIKVNDTIWKDHNPAQYQALGDAMSEVFADVVRANFGYQEDIFCGSGNSKWEDPKNPGVGEFTCTPVRIIVDNVTRGEVQADDSTAGALTINQQRLQNARALYGDKAEYWLGLQDTIEKCRGAGTTCVFHIGDNGQLVPTVPPDQP